MSLLIFKGWWSFGQYRSISSSRQTAFALCISTVIAFIDYLFFYLVTGSCLAASARCVDRRVQDRKKGGRGGGGWRG